MPRFYPPTDYTIISCEYMHYMGKLIKNQVLLTIPTGNH